MDQDQIQNQKNERLSLLYEVLQSMLIAACIVFLVFAFLGNICIVDGDSMKQTLYHGERLWVSDLFYEPEAGDIVVFQVKKTEDNSSKFLIKRVIATEGQFVKIESDGVYVSDDAEFDSSERLNEEYLYLERSDAIIDYYHVHGKIFEVPEGHVFVLGDNRNNSSDSRNPAIGFVDCRSILGKVIVRFLPISRFGAVQ